MCNRNYSVFPGNDSSTKSEKSTRVRGTRQTPFQATRKPPEALIGQGRGDNAKWVSFLLNIRIIRCGVEREIGNSHLVFGASEENRKTIFRSSIIYRAKHAQETIEASCPLNPFPAGVNGRQIQNRPHCVVQC
jgi:hypothetical protein